MDFSSYGQELIQLHEKHQEYLKIADKRVIGILNKMLQKALALNDLELIGYVYHSLAFAEHFVMGRYKAFLKYLALSARHLLRCPDQSEMMHVYYLVAIDAMNRGLNDIAVHYFQEARSIAEATGQETSAAILDQSIGHIYLQLGRYPLARTYIKKAMAGIRKDKAHPHYYSNLTANTMNDVIACLGMNKLDLAQLSFHWVTDFIQNHPNEFKSGTHLNYTLLYMQLSLANGDEETAAACYEQLMALMKEESMIHLFMDEIKKLSALLISQKRFDWLESIILLIEEKGISSDAIGAMKILVGIRIDYYKALGRDADLKESYRRQDEIQELSKSRQQALSFFIPHLVQLTTELQKDREAILARQNMLINMAEVDPLTKLFNRYAANQKLDEAFDAALKNQTKLGVVYLDVDGLKKVNDTQGHLAGDQQLVSLAETLDRESQGLSVCASRFGGDEFVIIFENKSSNEIADFISRVKKSCSIGFSSGFHNAVPRERQKSWYFLELADRALYEEKKSKISARLG